MSQLEVLSGTLLTWVFAFEKEGERERVVSDTPEQEPQLHEAARRTEIARLNDTFRMFPNPDHGAVFVTNAVASVGQYDQAPTCAFGADI